MPTPADPLEEAMRTQDLSVKRTGSEIWVGAEPTFTLRSSEAAEWLSEALGEQKELLARQMLRALAEHSPGAAILRTLGRQYRGEPRPRWSYGLYARRDSVPVWRGPPDPLTRPVPAEPSSLDLLHEALTARLLDLGWEAIAFSAGETLERRILFRLDGQTPEASPRQEPLLARPSIHGHPIPMTGLRDVLAARGDHLLALGVLTEGACAGCACVELPGFARVADFLSCLTALGGAATEARLPTLVLQGFPPPVDSSVAWTTVTPDPAVIEVNQAPYANGSEFLRESRLLYDVAAQGGLSPYRLQYNGTVTDSGGGGQFTLGGPSPERSPFFTAPALLPRLVRYVNHHPALSYLFAPEYVGSSSQSPRADEGVRDTFRELDLTLAHLASSPDQSPESIWRSLAPFMTDPSGNPHRSELNVEKLWNPFLPDRGCLGLVEFRAFRMSQSPERAAAIAALLRGITCMLATEDKAKGLVDWGDELHDRWALPFYLLRDLQSVLDDLTQSGLGLAEPVRAALRDDPSRTRWQADLGGCRLEIEKAIEFWPLVGDVASQEGGGSRLVDASTLRLQILLGNTEERDLDLADCEVRVGDWELPMRGEQGPWGAVRVNGVRFRDFAPRRGLHPDLQPQGAIRLTLSHPELDDALVATLHSWQPDGRPYPGLPADLDAAAARRAERLVLAKTPRATLGPARQPPAEALQPFSLDLRRL